MRLFGRKKKSTRKDLKQVYFYEKDFNTLKALSKEAKTSMTKMVHDILTTFLGFKYGDAKGEIKRLQYSLDLIANDCKEKREELQLYKEKFGQIDSQESK